MNKQRVCFTGHRPEKLNISERKVKELLKTAIIDAINDGYITFISGMARGIDIWSAEIVLELKKKFPEIHLICAIPYDGFEKRWDTADQERYNYILERADYIKYVCEHYSRQCFQIRNVFMVNHSNRVISAYNGAKGGTKNTIDYATRQGKEIINILDI